jgi:hypothetical protein
VSEPTTAPQTDGIRVNMSEQEASSTDRGDALPIGKFHFKITDMDIMFVKDQNAQGEANKNAGKTYINFEFTVQDTPGEWQQFAGRKDWTNAMCFDGALYTISQILKALGMDVPATGGFVIPDKREFYIGKDIMGRRGTNKNDYQMVPDGKGGNRKELRVQLRGFASIDGSSGTKVGSATAKSVLP